MSRLKRQLHLSWLSLWWPGIIPAGSLFHSPGCSCFPVTDRRDVTGPSAFSNTLSGLGLGGTDWGVTYMVTNSPTPSINASATLSGVNGLPPAGGSVSMGAVTNYSFEILDPLGPLAIASAVSLMVNAQGGLGFNSLSTNEGTLGSLSVNWKEVRQTTALLFWQELHQLEFSYGIPSGLTSDGFTIAKDYTFFTNTLITCVCRLAYRIALTGRAPTPYSLLLIPVSRSMVPIRENTASFFRKGLVAVALPRSPSHQRGQ